MSNGTMAELLHSALRELDAASDGHLHLQIRRQIRRQFGEVIGADEEAGPSDAVRALVRLDTLAVQHVLPFWDTALPDDHRPYRMLELADGLLNGSVTPEAARNERGIFTGAAQYLPELGDGGRASGVGQAAAKVISTALGAEISDESAPPGSDDDDVDPDLWDSTFYASLIEAPNFRLPNETPAEVEARRTFWRWWLTEAVPQVARDAGIDVD